VTLTGTVRGGLCLSLGASLLAAGAPAPPPGPFRFVDVAARLGITRVLDAGRPAKDHLLDSAGAGAAFLDYDKDGRLDVYLANGWRLDGAQVVERGKSALYRQRPDGSFEDVTDRAAVGGDGQWTTGVTVADYDNDGWPDILVTSFGRNLLYRNLGDGRFENVAARAGVEAPGWNTAAAFHVLHHNGLPRTLSQPYRNPAPNRVGEAADGKSHDEGDALAGIVRALCAADGRRSKAARPAIKTPTFDD